MKSLVKYIGEDWYNNLLDEISAIATESVWNSRLELLKGKWLIGQMICESEGYAKQQGKRGSFIQRIAKDIGRSQSDIYFCVQFYEKYQLEDFSNVLERLPEGKNISWSKLIHKYLPKSPKIQEEHKYITCLVDLETQTIWIPDKYKDYDIKYKE